VRADLSGVSGVGANYDVTVLANDLIIFRAECSGAGGTSCQLVPYPINGAEIQAQYPTWMTGDDLGEPDRQVTVLQIKTGGKLRFDPGSGTARVYGAALVPSLATSLVTVGQQELPVDAGYTLSGLAYLLSSAGGGPQDASVSLLLHGLAVFPSGTTPGGTATLTKIWESSTLLVIYACTAAGTVTSGGYTKAWFCYNPDTQAISVT
jgi:hypothetical protein